MFKAGKFNINYENKTQIMGILNITPDSFSDGNLYYNNPDKAVQRAIEIQNLGADIIDIGAQSTRPGYSLISPEQELERLYPVLTKLQNYISIPISIDTFYPEVAETSIKLGASIINYVPEINSNNNMFEIISRTKSGLILVCNKIKNKTCENIKNFFEDQIRICENYNISQEYLCLDPGLGFTETREQDKNIIKNLNKIKINNMPILIGASRKRFIRETFDKNQENNYYNILGTVIANTIAILNNSNIIRVHDIEEHVFLVKLINKIIN